MKKLVFSVSFVFLFILGSPDGFGQEAVKWMDFESAVAAQQETPRKILVDFYTDWCGWCKRMDKTTYENASVAKYINEHYYAVKFNAEGKEDVTVNGRTYKYKADLGRRGAHELAMDILGGRMSYPTTSFLDENMGIITNVAGYQGPLDFQVLLEFLGENHFKTKSFDDFQEERKN